MNKYNANTGVYTDRYKNKWSPISAWEWGNPRSKYVKATRCWGLIRAAKSSERGDVVASKGHVAIVVGGEYTISATRKIVSKYQFGYRAKDKPTFWRYTC